MLPEDVKRVIISRVTAMLLLSSEATSHVVKIVVYPQAQDDNEQQRA
jgi:hypothetical protein